MYFVTGTIQPQTGDIVAQQKNHKPPELTDFFCWGFFEVMFVTYSCFDKGPTKPYATMAKGIMGNGGSWPLIEALGVPVT